MAKMDIESDDGMAVVPSYDCCPRIYLTDDQVEALGITGVPLPGKTYQLTVAAVVESVTAEAEEADEVKAEGNKPDVRLTLKLTDITIVDSGKSIADTLYQD